MQSESLEITSGLKEESQLVTFLLKDEEFGFDIMSVQEIIRLPKMAKVPRLPDYIDGIANLRGVVLPVIDMRTRFGMERETETDRTRVLVIDIEGVKTGLRVDRVKQVARVLRSEIEPPPAVIRGSSSGYLEGVVKLENGQRIVMALSASQVCDIGSTRKTDSANKTTPTPGAAFIEKTVQKSEGADLDVQKMVTFRIAKEEFAFSMEHVREILRVQTPKHVPDVPDYVLGVLTVRGQILPVIDLRRLLQQRSFAEEVASGCRPLREEYERWIDQSERAFVANSHVKLSAPITEHLRKWLSETNSSSQVLMESLAKVRTSNERVIKQIHVRERAGSSGEQNAALFGAQELLAAGRETMEALLRFEQLIASSIHEDQRIIVVDSEGVVLGLVVDHVHEVLNVSANLIESPPLLPSSGGMELAGVAKLENGSRLIMVLAVSSLMKDQRLRELKHASPRNLHQNAGEASSAANADAHEDGEVQLVTFMLGGEEFGVPISQIQEIDRLGRVTKVPTAAQFIDGVTNLRGEVIPVLNTRRKFELETKSSDDRTRIIIVDLAGIKTGLVVDSVREVLTLARKDIAPPPSAMGSGIQQQFISGIGKVDAGQRMIVLLDVEKILTQQEQAQLSKIDPAAQ